MFGNNKVWVPLVDYEGHEVSSDGEIRNIMNGQILKTSINQSGVRYVALRNTRLGRYENRAVGTLVADAFCEGRSADAETVLHRDGNTENNAAANLMWSTRWHAMAFHQEIQKANFSLRKKVMDGNGHVYANVGEAAMATGCLPSAIDYAVRYNDNMSMNEHYNFLHRVYPGGHIFRSA